MHRGGMRRWGVTKRGSKVDPDSSIAKEGHCGIVLSFGNVRECLTLRLAILKEL